MASLPQSGPLHRASTTLPYVMLSASPAAATPTPLRAYSHRERHRTRFPRQVIRPPPNQSSPALSPVAAAPRPRLTRTTALAPTPTPTPVPPGPWSSRAPLTSAPVLEGPTGGHQRPRPPARLPSFLPLHPAPPCVVDQLRPSRVPPVVRFRFRFLFFFLLGQGVCGARAVLIRRRPWRPRRWTCRHMETLNTLSS